MGRKAQIKKFMKTNCIWIFTEMVTNANKRGLWTSKKHNY